MSRAGQYRHRIDIQDWVAVRDPETGGFTESWVTVFANVPARIADASGREFLAAEAIQSEIVCRMTIRARPGLNAKQRILHNGDIYNVHAWLRDQDSGRDYLSAPCSRGVNEG